MYLARARARARARPGLPELGGLASRTFKKDKQNTFSRARALKFGVLSRARVAHVMSCSDFNERFTLWIERSLLSKNYVPIKKSPHMGEGVKMAHFASGRFHHFQWCLLDYRNRAKIFIIEQKFQGLKHRFCTVLDIFPHKMRDFPSGRFAYIQF